MSGLKIAVLLSVAISVASAQPLSWVIETVDEAGNVGQYSSLALDRFGNPHICYHDDTEKDLRYATYDGASWQFDLALRYVDSLHSPLSGAAPHYIEMDLRLAWEPNEHFEAAIVGQNLLNSHHFESDPDLETGYYSNGVPRSVYASATWRY